MSPHTAALLLLTLWTSLQDGGGVSHRRTQRCACSTQMDSECHYFCHLDIIWINTPSKTTLYGLGSSASRRRRAAARCSCSRRADRTCAGFCDSSFKIQTEESVAKRPLPHLLSVLRGLADGSHKLKDAEHLETQNAFDASETNVG